MSSRSQTSKKIDLKPGWIEQVFTDYFVGDLTLKQVGEASIKFGSCLGYTITFYEILKPSPDIVFCINQTSRYFQFPHEAIVEALYSSNLDVLVSFHLPKDANLSVLHSACSCTTKQQKNTLSFSSKLEEFANMCARPKRRLTDPGLLISPFVHPKSDCYAINIGLTGVGEDLLSALKKNVLKFETRYEKMIELMKLHCQQVTAQKMLGPLDTERNDWVSSEEEESLSGEQMEGGMAAKNNNNKQCTYCGSKSTPMWRRGPDGAGTLCNACGVKWKHGKILCGGTEYFPPPIFKKRERKRYNGNNRKDSKNGGSKRAAATAAAAAIVAGNKYASDLDVLLDNSDEEHHHRRRHTTDISMIQTYGFNHHNFDANVDAVEAAAVLTLLKRS